MQRIGKIKLLQIQQRSLKVAGGDGVQVYDPSGIVNLSEIRLTTFGIVGTLDFPREDMLFLDVHHLRHPGSRFRGDNKISMGFSSHYDSMRAAFGGRLRDGQAGENIVVACERAWTPTDLGARLWIRSCEDGREIALVNVLPIPPCEPFARFARGEEANAPARIKADLQLLSDGMRGYYMEIESTAEAVVRLGDVVYQEADPG